MINFSISLENPARKVGGKGRGYGVTQCVTPLPDDDYCFYHHSWRNNVVIAFGTLSSFLT